MAPPDLVAERKEKELKLEWVITLAVLGLLCIFAEVFLPGGVLGVLGWLLIGASLVLAYREWRLGGLFFLLVFAFVGGGVLLYVLAFKVMPKTAVGKFIFLRHSQKGYDVSVPEDREVVGKEGVTLSFLRPAGIAQIDGKRVNVITEGDFIEKNARIKVCELRDNNLVVRRIESESQQPPGEV